MKVDVRVRHECDGTAQPFTTARIEDLDEVLRALRGWGFVANGADVHDHQFYGQFVYDEDGAYFEIVVTN